MNIYNYRSIFPHVATAIQLSNNERVVRGDYIEYVYTDSQHQNPLSRVVPAQFIRNNDSLTRQGKVQGNAARCSGNSFIDF